MLSLAAPASAGAPHTTLVGPVPHPHKGAILGYAPRYIYERSQSDECPLSRTTTFYLEQDAAGNSTGGSGNGTVGAPWLCADWGDAVTLIEAQMSPGKAFLIKRGEVFRCTHGEDNTLNITTDDITIGAYGTGAEPQIRRTTLYATGWTQNGSATEYIRTLATDVAWVINPTTNLYLTAPISRVSAVGDVPTTITGCGGTFFYNAGTDELRVDFGQNLNSVSTEVVFDNTDTAILATADGCRVDSLFIVGFGMDNGNEANQNSPLRFSGSGSEACLFTNCKCYYGSTHIIAQYGTSSGGYLGVANCEYGWAMPATTPTLLNGYAADGAHEFVCLNNKCIGAELPSTTTPVRDGASVYGHTNGTIMGALYICQGQRDVTTATTPFAPSILVWGNPTTVTSYNLAQYRAFWIDCDIPDVYPIFNEVSNCFINCTSTFTPVSGLAVVVQAAIDERAYLINHRYVFNLLAANTTSMTNYTVLNTAQTNDTHWDHCGVWFEGDTTDTLWWDRRLGFFSEEDPRVHRNCTYVNNTPTPNCVVSWGNNTTINDGCAYYNISSSTDAVVGVDLDNHYLIMGAGTRSTMLPGPGHELATNFASGKAAPVNLGLQYDCLGNARDPNNVVRGPYAVPFINFNSRPTIPVIE